MSDILSYYRRLPDGRTKSETLEQHIRRALEYAADTEGSRVTRLAKRIADEEAIRELAYISIMLHDAGKAFYQDNFQNNGEYLSFAGHEFVSAIIAKLFTDNLIMRGHGEELRAVVFAVYYHHHAMNPHYRRRFLEGSMKRAVERIGMTQPLYEVVSKFMYREYLDALRAALNNLRSSLNKGYVENNVEKIINERLMKSSNIRRRKLALLILDMLVIFDYLASKDRGEEVASTFSNAVRQFYDFWILRP